MKDLKNNISILFHYIKIAYNIDKLYVLIMPLLSFCKALIPLISSVTLKFIIDELTNQSRLKILLILVLIALLMSCGLYLISNLLTHIIEIREKKVIAGFEKHLGKKIMNMSFQCIEDPKVLDLKEKAIYPIRNQGVLKNMMENIVMIVQNIITLLSLAVLISTLNGFLLLVLIVFVAINATVSLKSQDAETEFISEIIKDNREMGYYRGLTQDFNAGKDIRLYQIKSLILFKNRNYIERSTNLFKNLMSKTARWNGISSVVVQAQISIIYGYITYEVINNIITIGSFSMYISAALSFCVALSSFLQTTIKFKQIIKFLLPYKQFEDTCLKNENQDNNTDLVLDDSFCIEFKNVSFKYPHSNVNVLNNICIKIKSGEKLSIVGVNGAGKSTFVKLLCRLYEPTEGEITLNGININSFDFFQYIQSINAIFQDFKVFDFSIAENIVMNSERNNDAINEIISNVGLTEKNDSLVNFIDMPLGKKFEENGVELSGGEYQKIALARALYRKAKIVILDEPTAALDPVSENEVFLNFNELAKDRTAIYISHRMSSCLFSDSIAVFSEGKIVQYGTHTELIKDKTSEYYKLFSEQAKYYK